MVLLGRRYVESMKRRRIDQTVRRRDGSVCLEVFQSLHGFVSLSLSTERDVATREN